MPERILYVNLPSDRSYPLGPVILASHVHANVPRAVQFILDLSLLPESQHTQALMRALIDLRPSAVAFSWRDIHHFAPHNLDPSFEALVRSLNRRDLTERLGLLAGATSVARRQRTRIRSNCELIRTARSYSPGLRVILGGAAVTLFGPWLRRRLPHDLAVIPGEGERSMEALARGAVLTSASFGDASIDSEPHPLSLRIDMAEAARVDPDYIARILPAYKAYLRRPVPIQTRRGSARKDPVDLHATLEGRGLRLREPEAVVEELRTYRDRWGVMSFRFVDSPWFGPEPPVSHAHSILEGILGAGGGIRWTGRLALDRLDRPLAKLAVRTGLWDFELAVPTGSSHVARKLGLVFDPAQPLGGLRYLAAAGFSGRVRLPLTLNLPGETSESLRETLAFAREAARILGEPSLIPVIQLQWVQPGTQMERDLVQKGYLTADHDPLRLDPAAVRSLLYNPGPLGQRIRETLAESWDEGLREEAGRVALAKLAEEAEEQADPISTGQDD